MLNREKTPTNPVKQKIPATATVSFFSRANIAVSGDFKPQFNTYHHPQAVEKTTYYIPSNLPTHATDYQPRPHLSQVIADCYAGQIEQSNYLVLSGPHGSGKKSLILNYVHEVQKKFPPKYTLMRLINAQTIEMQRLDTEYRLFARALGIENSHLLPMEHVLEAVNAALPKQLNHGRALIVFDNADSEEALTPYVNALKMMSSVDMVVTTSQQGWADAIPVAGFTIYEAIAYCLSVLLMADKTDLLSPALRKYLSTHKSAIELQTHNWEEAIQTQTNLFTHVSDFATYLNFHPRALSHALAYCQELNVSLTSFCLMFNKVITQPRQQFVLRETNNPNESSIRQFIQMLRPTLPNTKIAKQFQRKAHRRITTADTWNLIEDLKNTQQQQASSCKTHWNLPTFYRKKYVNREAIFKQVEQIFECDDDLVICTLSGLGGSGKTLFAIDFIHHAKYPFCAWFNADNPATLDFAFRQFAIEFGLIQENMQLPRDVITRHVLNYFESNPGWLLAFDNAQTLAAIQPYLPKTGGHILITTRSRNFPDHMIPMPLMTLEEARKLMANITQQDIQDDGIFDELGNLPLAVAQAGSYIKKRKIRCQDYCELLKEKKATLLNQKTLPAGDRAMDLDLRYCDTNAELKTHIKRWNRKYKSGRVDTILLGLDAENNTWWISALTADNSLLNGLLVSYKQLHGLIEPLSELLPTAETFKTNVHQTKEYLLTLLAPLLGMYHHGPTALTWDLHFLAFKEDGDTFAIELMKYASYLHAQEIPNAILMNLVCDPENQDELEQYELAQEHCEEYWLITAENSQTLNIHRLVQEVILSRQKDHIHTMRALITYIQSQLNCTPDIYVIQKRDRDNFRRWLPHVLSLISRYDEFHCDDKPLYIALHYTLAFIYFHTVDYHMAEKHLNLIESLAIEEYGNDSYITFNLLRLLGTAYQNVGKTQLAVDKLTLATQHATASKEISLLDQLQVKSDCANATRHHGDVQRAITQLHEVLESLQKQPSNTEIQRADAEYRLAVCYLTANQPQNTLALLEGLLDSRQKTASCGYAVILENIGNAYRLLGEKETAANYLKRSYSIYRAEFGDDNIETARQRLFYGLVLLDLDDDLTVCEQHLDAAYRVFSQVFQPTGPFALVAGGLRALLDVKKGILSEEVKVRLLTTLKILNLRRPAEHPDIMLFKKALEKFNVQSDYIKNSK